MKRIGIISLNINTDDLNYGAILHSYAFQKFLKKYSEIQTEIIDYIGPNLEKLNLKYPTLYYLKGKKYYVALMSLLRFFSHAKRYNKFREFTNKHMMVSERQYTQQELENADLLYDTIVCESDVIWSPGITQKGFDKSFFLAHPSMKKMKKVAYSASLGNASFSEEEEKNFIELLENVDCISCRETYASEYIRKITGRNVYDVVDPVLLLSSDEYMDIVSEPIIKEAYVLLYMPIEYNYSIVSEVKKYAKSRGLKLVELSVYPWDKILHKTITDAGVGDFLSLIKNAEIVFSNSFHAVCFSVIFRKEFYAFSRRTGKKIEDICSKFDLKERYLESKIEIAPKIDYGLVYNKLAHLKEESMEYIVRELIK